MRKTLTDSEINVRIAQMCGLVGPETPNYCSDLNAMFEAERYLLGHDQENYYKYATAIDRDHTPQWLVHVSAKRRALCLLKIYAND